METMTAATDDQDQAFIDALWAWLPEMPEEEREVTCAICGAGVPASWATEDGLCRECAAQ